MSESVKSKSFLALCENWRGTSKAVSITVTLVLFSVSVYCTSPGRGARHDPGWKFTLQGDEMPA
jgi:hypothetical protein